MMRMRRQVIRWAVSISATLCGFLLAPTGGIAETDVRISQFSGKPVPRFESLRYSQVNGRTGPTFDHPIAWTYERTGLPVLILKESPTWRRVRDPEGAEVWMHARVLSTKATGMVRRETELRRNTAAGAEAVALLQTGAIVEVLDVRQGWVEIASGDLRGWTEAENIWGGSVREAITRK